MGELDVGAARCQGDHKGSPMRTNLRLQRGRRPTPRVDPCGQPICIKLTQCERIPVGAGEVWSGVGTLVVARVPAHMVALLALPKEEPRHPLWSPARPWFAPCRITPSLLPSAGDHKGPHRH